MLSQGLFDPLHSLFFPGGVCKQHEASEAGWMLLMWSDLVTSRTSQKSVPVALISYGLTYECNFHFPHMHKLAVPQALVLVMRKKKSLSASPRLSQHIADCRNTLIPLKSLLSRFLLPFCFCFPIQMLKSYWFH